MRLQHYRQKALPLSAKSEAKGQIPAIKRGWVRIVEVAAIVLAAVSAAVTTWIAWVGFAELEAERNHRRLGTVIDAWNLLDNKGESAAYAVSLLTAEGVSFDFADLSELRLDGVELTNTSAKYADFSGSRLSNMTFENTDLAGANFRCAFLNHVDFRGANMLANNFVGTIAPNLSSARRSGASEWGHFEGSLSWVLVLSSDSLKNLPIEDEAMRTAVEWTVLTEKDFEGTDALIYKVDELPDCLLTQAQEYLPWFEEDFPR